MNSDKMTDRKLLELELRIKKTYKQAADELGVKARQYFSQFEKRFHEEYAAYQEGKYTKEQFVSWYYAQVARGKRFEQMRDQCAERITDANVIASRYINGALPEVFVNNANYEQYMFAMDYGKTYGIGNFTIYSEDAVKRLMTDYPQLLPFAKTRIERPKDQKYWQGRIQNAIMQGIIQGNDIRTIADNIYDVTGGAYSAAVRNARTAFTQAQNSGRQESYQRANDMGIEVNKRWIATLDEKTRESHRQMDGETVPFDEQYSNGLMYPADPNGDPSEVWNCRCTEERVRSTRERPYTTYNEWLNGAKVEGRWAREFTTVKDENGNKIRVSTLDLARKNSRTYGRQ